MNYYSQFELYFYRDSNGKEIDLVIDMGYKCKLAEIKLSKTPSKNLVKSLDQIKNLFPSPDLYLISSYDESIPIYNEIKNIPVFDLLQIIR